MRGLCLAAGVLLAAGPAATAGELRLAGFAWGRVGQTRGQPSWLEGGFGRLTEGARAAGADSSFARGDLELALDWRPTPVLLVHAQGLAHGQPARDRGRVAGLSEAFVQYRPDLSAALTLRLRAGMFFPPTSRENVGPLWSSPYTLTFSALNTWIAEELRLTGFESAVVLRSASGAELQVAGSAFGLADTSGTLLAWRGWSLGDRLTTLGETLPLPPLTSLGPSGAFARQQDAGTQPVEELDGRIGWQIRGRWSRPGGALLQVAYLDTEGDRGLHRGQYAWYTHFAQVGGELRLAGALRLLGEAAQGDTGMGPAVGAHVDLRFRVGYLLLTWGGERARASLRYDHFENTDRDGTAEPNNESGSAWTAAVLWSPQRHLRLGAEFLSLRSQRPAAAFSGADPTTDARRLLLEARLGF